MLRLGARKLLGIVVVGLIATATLNGSCLLDTETTLCGRDLRCPPGWICSADQSTCTKRGSCGDGLIDEGEVCDDGNNRSRDGCSADCISDESCGNNIVDVAVGEICDDGNGESGDGCSADCTSESCGNLLVDVSLGEECDTGPGDSFGCDQDCTFRKCGDGYVNKVAEDCDILNVISDTPSCDSDCTSPRCGDKHTNPNYVPPGMRARSEQCDEGENAANCNGNDNDNATAQGQGDCQRPVCGDSYLNPLFKSPGMLADFERCDTGGNSMDCNGNDNDNAIAKGKGDCQEPACGDSYYNPMFRPPGILADFEQCDTGGNSIGCNGNDNDNATAQGKGDCRMPMCGDGYRNPMFKTAAAPNGEECDTAGDSQTCDSDCTLPSCGDGHWNPTLEQCDNGVNNSNSTPNACRINCRKPSCGDGVVDNLFGEVCDTEAPSSCTGTTFCKNCTECATTL